MNKQYSIPCACANARQASRMLTQLYDFRLRSAGIEAPQFILLMTLDAMGPCTAVDLTRQGEFDKTTLSRNLKILEQKGWIALSPSKQDGRKHLLALTSTGRKTLAKAKPEWEAGQKDLRAAMGKAQWEQMFVAFQSLAQAVSHLRG